MEIKTTPYENFEFEQVYHLFTRVSGNELIFRKEGNYDYFLKQLSKYLLPYLEIYAYCLVPQRLSLLVCFRSKNEVFKNINLSEKEMSAEQEHKFLMQPISNLLNSYSKAYNKMFQRKGALFIDYIKRERIDEEGQLKNIFKEIHQIPMQHQFVKSSEEWKYSSFKAYLNTNKSTKVSTDYMIGFFDDCDDLIQFHKIT
ncbi:transposase [Kaistella sp.]|uniref:transposase n=1 Tax=Kaistella sp. TaxID=2782235 RepID=UPI003C6181E6